MRDIKTTLNPTTGLKEIRYSGTVDKLGCCCCVCSESLPDEFMTIGATQAVCEGASLLPVPTEVNPTSESALIRRTQACEWGGMLTTKQIITLRRTKDQHGNCVWEIEVTVPNCDYVNPGLADSMFAYYDRPFLGDPNTPEAPPYGYYEGTAGPLTVTTPAPWPPP